MVIFPLLATWLVVPPVLGYLVGRWWALAPSLLFFPAFAVWGAITPTDSSAGEPVFEPWFGYLLAFLFLSLPPLGLSAVAIAWRRWG